MRFYVLEAYRRTVGTTAAVGLVGSTIVALWFWQDPHALKLFGPFVESAAVFLLVSAALLLLKRGQPYEELERDWVDRAEIARDLAIIQAAKEAHDKREASVQPTDGSA